MAVTLPSVYQDGTATAAANGTVVTGQSTLWANAVLPGDFFGVHKGYAVRILSVDSNTQLTLANPWPGGAQTAAHYEIMLCPDTSRMQETSRQLLQQLSNGNIAAFTGLAGAADTLGYFTGAGTMALTGLTATGRDIIDSPNVSAAQTALGVSDFIKTLLNDADGPTALATLGAFPLVSSSWVKISDTSFSGVSSVNFTNLGSYRRLRMIGTIAPSIATGIAYRTSTNNGTSYDNGSTDYATQNVTFSGSTVSTNSVASPQGAMSGGLQVDAGNAFMFEAEFEAFNSNSNLMTSISRGRIVNGGNLGGVINFGHRVSSVNRNAFLIFPPSGGTLAGRILLEGCA